MRQEELEKKCNECIYQKNVRECLEALKNMVEQTDMLQRQFEELKKENDSLIEKNISQKKGYEKKIRDLQRIPAGEGIHTSSVLFQRKLAAASEEARQRIINEKKVLIRKMQEKYSGKRVLFVLPAGRAGGGSNVIVSEAMALREFGVDAKILNLLYGKKEFENDYAEFRIPVIYVEQLEQAVNYKKEYDIICATACMTVGKGNFLEIANYTKVAYYIQDYEPFFERAGTAFRKMAEESYTLVPQMHCVTKTKWNQDILKEELGVEASLLLPSVNINIFEPQKENFKEKGTIMITAMIRPFTPRRAAGKTMQILERIFWKFGKKVEINIFGFNEQAEKIFYMNANTNFDYKNHELITSKETAELLRKADIFVDFSDFQAMGLAAMEAMASGCAVIVPQNGGAVSYAEHEKNALVIDTADMEQCYDALVRLVEDYKLREQLSLQAVIDICQYYPERSAAKFLEIILDTDK